MLKTNSKRKKQLIDYIFETISNKLGCIVLVFIVIALLSPVIVWKLYGTENKIIYTEITANGILAYIGAIIGSSVSLLVSIIAIAQAVQKIYRIPPLKQIRKIACLSS